MPESKNLVNDKNIPISSTTQGEKVRLDVDAKIDGGLPTITYLHHKVHEGLSYDIKGFVDLTNGDVVDFRVTTPNTTEWAHFRPMLDIFGGSKYIYYEGVSITTVGTTLTPKNKDRNSGNASGVSFDIIENANLTDANSDTDITGATNIYDGKSGGASVKIGNVDSIDEFILKQNTIYCFRIEATVSTTVDYLFSWYESENTG